MNARDYYLRLQNAIHAAPHVLRSELRFEEIGSCATVHSSITTGLLVGHCSDRDWQAIQTCLSHAIATLPNSAS